MELLREACCSALRRIRTAAADGVAQRRVRVGDCTLHRGPSQGAATNLHVKKKEEESFAGVPSVPTEILVIRATWSNPVGPRRAFPGSTKTATPGPRPRAPPNTPR